MLTLDKYKPSAKLTQNGQDDDDEIEQVPRFDKVVVAQREDLHQTLATEDTDEDHVQVVQHRAERFRLLVVIQRHRQHVEADEQHDDHVELFVCADFEHYCLWSPLEEVWKVSLVGSIYFGGEGVNNTHLGPRNGLQWLLRAHLLHCVVVLFLVLRHKHLERSPSLLLLFVKVVNNDTDEEVQREERSEDDEEHKVQVHVDVGFADGLLSDLLRVE